MITTRDYEFISGIETPSAPTSSDQTNFTIADNQSSYANITGWTMNVAFSYQEFRYKISRTDGSTSRLETGIIAFEKLANGNWQASDRRGSSDALNVIDSLFITTGGQVQYKSDSMGGTYSGSIIWKLVNFIV